VAEPLEGEPALLVAQLVYLGLPVVPSDKRRCSRCMAEVWVSKRGDAFVGRIVCIVCAMSLMRPGDTVTPAAWVLEDLELLR